MPAGTMTKTTREKIAACAAHGFYFWSDHPDTSTLWATDDNQRWHMVRMHRKTGKAEHSCNRYDGFTDHCREGRGRVIAYDIPTDMAGAASLMGLTEQPEPVAQPVVVEPVVVEPTRRARPATVVASLLNHDPTWMVPFSDTELHSALGLTRHDHAIRTELDRRREAS